MWKVGRDFRVPHQAMGDMESTRGVPFVLWEELRHENSQETCHSAPCQDGKGEQVESAFSLCFEQWSLSSRWVSLESGPEAEPLQESL